MIRVVAGALREIVRARRFPFALAFLAGAFLIADLWTQGLGLVVSTLALAAAYGYSLSYARCVVVSTPGELPSLFDPSHIRRAVGAGALLLLPGFAAIVVVNLLAIPASLIFGDIGEYLSLISGLGLLFVVTGCTFVVQVPVLARYVFTDRFTASTGYVDSVRGAWRRKRQVAVPVIVNLATLATMIAVNRVNMWAYPRPARDGLLQVLGRLASGAITADALGAAAIGVFIALLAAVFVLLNGRLLGEYSRQAYAAESQALLVGPTRASS